MESVAGLLGHQRGICLLGGIVANQFDRLRRPQTQAREGPRQPVRERGSGGGLRRYLSRRAKPRRRKLLLPLHTAESKPVHLT